MQSKSSIRPCPTCCMCRGAPTKCQWVHSGTTSKHRWKTHLGERDVGDDDDVESRGSILLDAGVTTGVVLVGAGGGAALLPGLAVLSLGDGALRGGAGGGAGWGEDGG
jgi:hypothetical protein